VIIALFIGIALIATAGHSPIHPGAMSMLTRSKLENVECRQGPGPGSVLEAPRANRTSQLGVTGSYECYRPVFREDERNPYFDRALEAEYAHAKIVAQSVARRLEGQQPVTVAIEGEIEPELRENIGAIYRTELTAALGSNRVLRAPGEKTSILQIQVFRVDVPELMSKARLKTMNANGEARWLDI
jgi:hypothetical protein